MASKYKDPASVNCPDCAARSSQRVADLLALKATCANCGSSLAQTGLSMRRALDEWATFVAALIMLLRLEDRLGTKFNDDEAYGVKSLRDLANIVAARLEQRDEAAPRSVELTTWAVGELAESPFWGSRPGRRLMAGTSPLDFDAPLLDVLDPGRWEGAPDSLRA